jgi:hypothetical protein
MAALVGMLRHAEIYTANALANSGGTETQPQRNQKIIAAALKVVEETDPPQGRTPEGHAWMRRRALDILIALRAPGNSVADVVYAILNDPDEPVSLRLTAAEAVAKLNIKAPNGDPATTAETVAAIAVEVCQSELAWWDAEKKREEEKKLLASGAGVGGYAGGAYPGSYPGSEGYGTPGTEDMMAAASPYGDSGYPSYAMGAGVKVEPKKKKVDPRIDRTQRRLKNTLYYVKLALDGDATFAKPRPTRPNEPPPKATEGGLLAQGDANQDATIGALSTAVVEMFTTIDTAEPEREKMLTDLAANLQKLKGLTGTAASAPGSGAPPGAGAPPGSAGPGSAGPSSAGPSSAVPGPSSSAPAPKAAVPGPNPAAPAPAPAAAPKPAAAPAPAPNGAAPAAAPNGAAPVAPGA